LVALLAEPPPEDNMPRPIIDVDTLKQYILGVMARAEHHGRRVDEICLAIAGAIIWRANDIEVFERQGEMTNVLWMHVGETRYALSFNHDTGEIEIRRGTTQGSVLASLSNATPIAEIKRLFNSL
jgi:hypothetical protein